MQVRVDKYMFEMRNASSRREMQVQGEKCKFGVKNACLSKKYARKTKDLYYSCVYLIIPFLPVFGVHYQ